jgi:hypothetical protein
VARTGSADFNVFFFTGATRADRDNVRINPRILFDNIVERIDATNFHLLNVSVSVVVVELCIS